MSFSPEEAEQILREEWSDAALVGGFWSSNCRDHHMGELVTKFGEAALQGWKLIGVIEYTDYDEGWTEYLFVGQDDLFYSFSEGSSCYGGNFGESFSEISQTNISDWLDTVNNVAAHNETFTGC